MTQTQCLTAFIILLLAFLLIDFYGYCTQGTMSQWIIKQAKAYYWFKLLMIALLLVTCGFLLVHFELVTI